MKSIILFFISLLFFLKGFGQYLNDILLSDSIYKTQKVKAMILIPDEAKGAGKSIYLFDKNGWLAQIIQVDSGGTKYMNKNVFKFNEKGQLLDQFDVCFYIKDSNTHKIIIDEQKPDTSFYKLSYDSLGRLSKKTVDYKRNKTHYECAYTYNPFMSKEQYSSIEDTGLKSEINIAYENGYFLQHVFGYGAYRDSLLQNRVKKFPIDYSYENTFDSSHRILSRIGGINEPAFNMPDKTNGYGETLYQYSSAGLLIKRTIIDHYRSGLERKYVLLFDYKFW